jgi:hypothetical protein
MGALGPALGPLGGLLTDLQTAVSGVARFADADQSTLASVRAPLMAVQLCVSDGIVAAEDAVAGGPPLGGVAPGMRPSDMVAAIQAQTLAVTTVADLYDLHNTTARMATNLAAIGSAGAVVTVAGANLFEIAALAYGDASEWATIAKANGVTEPMLSGVRSLLIPPTPGGTGGVLKEIVGGDSTLADVVINAETGESGLDYEFPDNAIFTTV